MSAPGIGYTNVGKRTADLFRRWRSSELGLRAMWNAILPVVVVDRYRDDDEGSIYGLTVFTGGNPTEFPSAAFGSGVNDWELLGIHAGIFFPVGASGFANLRAHLFTPILPYNPVVNLNPVGFFSNQLLTNRDFTFGTVQGVGGTNPVLPFQTGFQPGGHHIVSSIGGFFTPIWGFRSNYARFDPPIRIFADVTLAAQLISPVFGGLSTGWEVSILYRERPKSG